MKARVSLVDRFFRTLVEEIREQEPSYLDSAFTVAEIYQTLVPYRTHRDRIGAELNGDYEDALLRLLAGERDYLVLESDTARERILLELRSSNPNTGLYREYAAVSVRLNSDSIPNEESPGKRAAGAADTDDGPTDAEVDELVGKALGSARHADLDDDLRLDELLGERLEDEKESKPSSARPEPPRQAESSSPARSSQEQAPEAARGTTPSGGTGGGGDGSGGPTVQTPTDRVDAQAMPEGLNLEAVPDDCPDCNGSLPSRDGLRFCPHCGTNVFVVPCSSCGEVLEREWNFCVICGEPAD